MLKLVGRFFNLSISNLSTSDFELARSTFLAKNDVQIENIEYQETEYLYMYGKCNFIGSIEKPHLFSIFQSNLKNTNMNLSIN